MSSSTARSWPNLAAHTSAVQLPMPGCRRPPARPPARPHTNGQLLEPAPVPVVARRAHVGTRRNQRSRSSCVVLVVIVHSGYECGGPAPAGPCADRSDSERPVLAAPVSAGGDEHGDDVRMATPCRQQECGHAAAPCDTAVDRPGALGARSHPLSPRTSAPAAMSSSTTRKWPRSAASMSAFRLPRMDTTPNCVRRLHRGAMWALL
jgi:hypothetical protein